MIETIDLTKKYGDFYALESLNLKLEKGDLFGFIGPNGGKTTTIRILSTLLANLGRSLCLRLLDLHPPREIRRAIGYMPDIFGVYDDMRVIEYLEFFAAAYRIDGHERRRVAERSLELVDLAFKRDELVTSLSRGMTQRLGLARVLLHDPQVLLLDEPASGLDPRARIEMRGLLKRLQGLGKTILVSSHILPELADICNRVGIIEYGRLLACGNVQDLLAQVRGRPVIRFRLAGPPEKAAAAGDVARSGRGGRSRWRDPRDPCRWRRGSFAAGGQADRRRTSAGLDAGAGGQSGDRVPRTHEGDRSSGPHHSGRIVTGPV